MFEGYFDQSPTRDTSDSIGLGKEIGEIIGYPLDVPSELIRFYNLTRMREHMGQHRNPLLFITCAAIAGVTSWKFKAIGKYAVVETSARRNMVNLRGILCTSAEATFRVRKEKPFALLSAYSHVVPVPPK